MATVLGQYDLPKGSAGYLEWMSGVLRVAGDHRQVVTESSCERVDVADLGDRPDIMLSMTAFHEVYHYRQIVISGFLYRFVSEIFRLFADGAQVLLRTESPVQLLGRTIAMPPAVTQKMVEIDRVGASGLSVRDIVESAAFMAEFRRYTNMSAQRFAQEIVPNVPAPEYGKAFLALEKQGGTSFAYETLLPLCFVSLLFSRPQDVFVYGAIFAQTRKLDLSADLEWRELHRIMGPMMKACQDLDLGECLGTGLELFESKDIKHPVYTPAMLAMSTTKTTEGFFTEMFYPEASSDDVPKNWVPVLYDGGAVSIPPDFANPRVFWGPQHKPPRTGAEGTETRMGAQILMGALAIHAARGAGNSGTCSRFHRF